MTEAEQGECPWQRVYDEESQSHYYYNRLTEASEWDVPAGWEDHDFEAREDDSTSAGATNNTGSGTDAGASLSAAADGDASAGNGDAEYDTGALEAMDVEAPAMEDGVRQGDDGEEAEGVASVRDGDDDGGASSVATGGTPPAVDPEFAPASPEEAPDETQVVAEGATCDWTAIEDDSGNIYYYNNVTQESTWDKPEEYARFQVEQTSIAAGGEEGDGTASAQQRQQVSQSAGRSEGNEYGNDDDQLRQQYAPVSPPPVESPRSSPLDEAAHYSARTPSPEPSPEEYAPADDDGPSGSASDPDTETAGATATTAEPTRRSSRKKTRTNRLGAAGSTTAEGSYSPTSPEAAADGGMAFPSYGETYSPVRVDDQEEEEEEEEGNDDDNEDGAFGEELRGRRGGGSRGGEGGYSAVSTSSPGGSAFGTSPYSPADGGGGSRGGTSSGGASSGFGVGELSPIHENGALADGRETRGGGQNRSTATAAGGGTANEGIGGQETDGKRKENGVAAARGGKLGEASNWKRRLQNAEKEVAALACRLEEPDAAMEADAINRVLKYVAAMRRLRAVQAQDPDRKGQAQTQKDALNEGVAKIIQGYKGFAHQALLMNSWLNAATDKEQDAESLMVQQLTSLIKENFDARKADALLDSGSGVPSWLTAMQGDDQWRRTLIELAREHRGSALLRFVLKQLSDKGHHREIAAVISETDLFSVFNGVLKDTLARIPGEDEMKVQEDVADLKRICCSTAYMFMYSQQLLLDLEHGSLRELFSPARAADGCVASNSKKKGDGSRKRVRDEGSATDSSGAAAAVAAGRGAARKYKRLRQELAKHMYEASGLKDARSRKDNREKEKDKPPPRVPSGAFVRAIEEALVPGEAGSHSAAAPAVEAASKAASEAVVSMLQNVKVGAGMAGGGLAGALSGAGRGVAGSGARRMAVLGEAVEALISAFRLDGARRAALEGATEAAQQQAKLEDGTNNQTRPPAVLLRHPVVMSILLEALFDPSYRSPSEDIRTGCCVLLSYASCVEVPAVSLTGGGRSAATADTANGALSRQKNGRDTAAAATAPREGEGRGGRGGEEVVDLGEVAQTCHALMQAGNVCFDMGPSHVASLQGRLRRPAEHPVVSLGILKWIESQVLNEGFTATASFLSYAPVFLKLCGQAADDQPPQRPQVLEILKVMLTARTAPDTPTSAKARLKQLILLQMVHLMVKGYVLPVLSHMKELASKQGLDQVQMRFFLAKVVEIAAPRGGDATGYSPAFIHAMADLMGMPKVKAALQGHLLSPQDRQRMNSYARYCLKFQSKDLTKEAMKSIEQLQSGLERQ